MDINGYLCILLRIIKGAQSMSTVSLQQNVIKEVASLFDNEEALRKVLTFVKKVKREVKAESQELTAGRQLPPQ